MAVTKLAFTVGIILAVLLIIPASASAATGGNISGTVEFPADAYAFYSANESTPSEKITVNNLTIYARNVNTNFVNVTKPDANGTFVLPVDDNGKYQIFVKPDSIVDMSRGASLPQFVEYPNREGTRLYVIEMNGQDVTANIQGYAPGYYQPPNSLTLDTQGGASTTVATPQPSATPAPTPGFMPLIVIAGMVVAAVALFQRKN